MKEWVIVGLIVGFYAIFIIALVSRYMTKDK
jgi:hypothetical protein